ncbi:hypothetical protein [Pantoea ananatis]|uniref:hypothetical protein n=1 Tax=Pantoea ananas TaxID=553 RepID=UPI000D6D2F9E|nr:hypothetical protein [Pantoea ananatis]PWK10445.1 hypothetical protein C7421_102102 [Pantoea ananatis]
MLFTYHPNALAQNWLNSAIITILNNGMNSIIDGQAITAWPEILPERHREALKTRWGIRDRLNAFWAEYIKLERHDQDSLLVAMREQTSLPDIFSNDIICSKIDEFPKNIRIVIDDLFRFLFEKQLTSIIVGQKSLRDLHYKTIYENIPSKICPFCGLGYLRAPDAPRHALDHYLPISKYPFAGADLRNLTPMCTECNSDFKKVTDILIDDNQLRVHCSDPYNGPTFKIKLAESIPFRGRAVKGIKLPLWIISFDSEFQDYAENWDRIFKIRERYERDILNENFRFWLEHFAVWYSNPRIRNAYDEITDSLSEYIEIVIQDGFSDRAFLKVEVFNLIKNECNHPERGDDMKAFLNLLIETI